MALDTMRLELDNFKTYLSSITSIEETDFNLAIPFIEIKELKKGDYLLEEGKIANQIAFISKGLFRIFKLKKGNELNSCFCFEHDIISSFESLIHQKPSSEFIQALEGSVILTLSYKKLENLCKQNLAWNSIRTVFTEKECLRLSNRVDEMSFETALEKYQNLITLEPHVVQRVSNFHIASYLGISRETLSRIRAKIS